MVVYESFGAAEEQAKQLSAEHGRCAVAIWRNEDEGCYSFSLLAGEYDETCSNDADFVLYDIVWAGGLS